MQSLKLDGRLNKCELKLLQGGPRNKV